jgi:hypothetical protein
VPCSDDRDGISGHPICKPTVIVGFRTDEIRRVVSIETSDA